MKTFIGSKAECEAVIAKMDALCGYPSKDAETYAVPIPYGHALDKTFKIFLKPVYTSKMGRYSNVSEMEDRLGVAERSKLK